LVDVIAKFNVDLTAQLGAEFSTNPVTKSARISPKSAHTGPGHVYRPETVLRIDQPGEIRRADLHRWIWKPWGAPSGAGRRKSIALDVVKEQQAPDKPRSYRRQRYERVFN
jgi:hypothetical protein